MDLSNDMELYSALKNIKDNSEEEAFIKKYASDDSNIKFHEYLQEYIVRNDLSMAYVMNNSRLNKNYGYNIVNGTRENPGRDKVLALCIGAEMSFDAVQQALKLANHPLLDPRNERDIRIAVAINKCVRDVIKVNLKLEENNLEPLHV